MGKFTDEQLEFLENNIVFSDDSDLSQEEKDRAKFVDTMIRQHAKRIAIMNEYSVEEYDQVIEFAEKRAIHAFLHAIMVPTQGKRKQSIARKFAYCASCAAQASLEQQTAKIKELLIWFREEFPYYYSKCDYNNNDDGMGGMGGQWGQSPGMNPMAGGMAGAGSTHNPMMYTGSGKEQEEQYDEDYIGASEAGSQANSGKSVDSNTPGRSVNNARGPMSRIDQLNNAEDTLNEEGM